MINWDKRNERWRWQFDRRVDGERVRTSKLLPAGLTEEQARALAGKLEAEQYMKRRMVAEVGGWDDYVDALLADRSSWIYSTVTGCRSRSTEKGRQCSLTAAQLADIMRRSRGRCEVTGLPFQVHKPTDSRARPFFHSLDRRDASRGYVDGNCRLVCYAANLAMSNWGEEVFAQIATGYVVNRYCALGLMQHALAADPILGESPRTLSVVR
jgi:hypothetical protein